MRIIIHASMTACKCLRRNAFRRLALLVHPDKNPGDEEFGVLRKRILLWTVLARLRSVVTVHCFVHRARERRPRLHKAFTRLEAPGDLIHGFGFGLKLRAETSCRRLSLC